MLARPQTPIQPTTSSHGPASHRRPAPWPRLSAPPRPSWPPRWSPPPATAPPQAAPATAAPAAAGSAPPAGGGGGSAIWGCSVHIGTCLVTRVVEQSIGAFPPAGKIGRALENCLLRAWPGGTHGASTYPAHISRAGRPTVVPTPSCGPVCRPSLPAAHTPKGCSRVCPRPPLPRPPPHPSGRPQPPNPPPQPNPAAAAHLRAAHFQLEAVQAGAAQQLVQLPAVGMGGAAAGVSVGWCCAWEGPAAANAVPEARPPCAALRCSHPSLHGVRRAKEREPQPLLSRAAGAAALRCTKPHPAAAGCKRAAPEDRLQRAATRRTHANTRGL